VVHRLELEREILAVGIRSSTRAIIPLVLTAPLPPFPRRHRLRIGPQAFLRLSCFRLQSFEHGIPWCILPIPPAPAVFDQRVIDVGAIRQEHISKGASVAILPIAAVLWGHGISRFRRRENPHPIWHTGGVKWSRAHFHDFVARC
jgi:hypothetical protein